MAETQSRSHEPHWLDPIIDEYKKKVDRNVIRENLKLTPDQRLRKLQAMLRDPEEIRRAMRRAHVEDLAEWEMLLKGALVAHSQRASRDPGSEENL